MADTTTPTTPPAQDLEINLDSIPKEEIKIPENKGSELNLDLDLNLPEAPKNDDRLKTEDQKNAETVVETPIIEAPVETPVVEQIPAPIVAPTVEEIIVPEPIQTTPVETPVETIEHPSTTIEAIPSSPDNLQESSEKNLLQSSSLQEDMKMIDELEGHQSAGGLAPEAIVVPQSAPVEAPKTFDLDAMLGSPTVAPVGETPISQPMPQTEIPMPQPMPVATGIPMQTPINSSSVIIGNNPLQSSIHKNTGVKVLLFVVMFIALGFTTFFILKTMYPIEFGNLFGGGSQIQTDELTGIVDLTGTELTGTELTGIELTGAELPVDQISGDVTTGTHESAVDNGFGELNDLGTAITDATPAQNDIGRLTDYVTQGNKFLEDGKTMNNNTIIKYGLYISKKATTFLEKIANGEEINNLTGYFAQFDQYIAKLQELAGQASNTDASLPTSEAEVSPTLPTNEIPGMTTDTTTPTPDIGATSE